MISNPLETHYERMTIRDNIRHVALTINATRLIGGLKYERSIAKALEN